MAGTVKQRLRVMVAERGRSMEEEVREILAKAASNATPVKLGSAMKERFADLGGVELTLPERQPMREPPDSR